MHTLRLQTPPNFERYGELYFLHDGKRSRTGAFDKQKNAIVEVLIPRCLGAFSVCCEIFSETGEAILYRIDAVWEEMRGAFDVYRADFSLIGVGLYFFRICIKGAFGCMYGCRRENRIVFIQDEGQAKANLQVSVSDFAYNEPRNQFGGIIYHIFVDRFAKGGEYPLRDGAILNEDWDNGIPQYAPYPGAPLKNNMFFGGTLDGVTENLDYIAGLGVTLIYLSPIFESPSNHKYDTADYMRVDPMFGGEKALARLIAAAKERGIGILLDGVFNHTGADSVYFNKFSHYPSVGAYQSPDSPYYSWFDFQRYPDQYTCWWNIDILPRIHPDVKACGDYFVGENGVVRHYAAMGIAGFRLDVADELSDAFISRIKTALNAENPHSVLYGEVWEDASNKIAYDVRKTYYLGRELDGVMNYPVRDGLVTYLVQGDERPLAYALTDVVQNAPTRILNAQMNLLGTHDTERILTVLGGDPRGARTNAELSVARMSAEQRTVGRTRLMMAYTVLATLPGIPSIYYGDEAGVEGYQDPFNRMPFPWGREDAALLDHYRAVGVIRRHHAVYREGTFRLLHLTKEHLLFARFDRGHAFLTALNRGSTPLALSFSEEAKDLLTGKSASHFDLAPDTASVYRVGKGSILSFL